jgi:hypothetical protein
VRLANLSLLFLRWNGNGAGGNGSREGLHARMPLEFVGEGA